MPFKFRDTGGPLVIPKPGESVVCTLIEDLGKIPVTGKYALDAQGNQKYQEGFKVHHDGSDKTLVGSWRLRKALIDAVKGTELEHPQVKIETEYVIEPVGKEQRRMEVKAYKVHVLDQDEIDASNIPF